MPGMGVMIHCAYKVGYAYFISTNIPDDESHWAWCHGYQSDIIDHGLLH